jgi:hypothetical protein
MFNGETHVEISYVFAFHKYTIIKCLSVYVSMNSNTSLKEYLCSKLYCCDNKW